MHNLRNDDLKVPIGHLVFTFWRIKFQVLTPTYLKDFWPRTGKDQIDYISKKIAKGIGVIIKAQKVFDKTTLLSIYNSLILPYIGYCIHIWENAYQTHLQKLHVSQNKIVGIIAGVPRRISSDHLYCELNTLKLKKLYVYAVGLCMYKYENYMLPEIFKDMFIKVTDVHEHDKRNATTGSCTSQCSVNWDVQLVRCCITCIMRVVNKSVM